jgi:hypothetical protein
MRPSHLVVDSLQASLFVVDWVEPADHFRTADAGLDLTRRLCRKTSPSESCRASDSRSTSAYPPPQWSNICSTSVHRPGRREAVNGRPPVATSHYTMDARNPAARREIARLADLVGAAPLPSPTAARMSATAGTMSDRCCAPAATSAERSAIARSRKVLLGERRNVVGDPSAVGRNCAQRPLCLALVAWRRGTPGGWPAWRTTHCTPGDHAAVTRTHAEYSAALRRLSGQSDA